MTAASCARWPRASSRSTAAQLTSWPGDWDNYLRRREERLHAEAQENARFDKMLAQEEVWIRQGIKARRTRDEGRVRRLKAMRDERMQRREQTGNVRMEAAQAECLGPQGDRGEGRLLRASAGASCSRISRPRSCAATASA